jgi:hypothetical protein
MNSQRIVTSNEKTPKNIKPISNLQKIITATNNKPTIVNPNSNFVVVTYWWGRNNYNQNTARPCISFFEEFTQKILKTTMNIFKIIYEKNKEKLPKFISSNLENELLKIPKIIEIQNSFIKKYKEMIYEYTGVPVKNESEKKDIESSQILDNLKKSGKTPENYEYKSDELIKEKFIVIFKEIIKINGTSIFNLFETNNQINKVKEDFLNMKEQLKDTEKNKFKKIIDDLWVNYKNFTALYKSNLKLKKNFEEINPKYSNHNIFDLLNEEFRFLNPIKFEEMIDLWEKTCKTNGCNYLAIEYPEFAAPGGYQMAINAKPLFIKKALELCEPRAVLYIDGDMYIRKYPQIFDLTDVDFMARGWQIDPRSSYKFTESISYDPYTFETSGGTMFFAQSPESKFLIDKWIDESEKSYQQGKADDRILSLVFNTYKLLCSMKIIQLPIEYLWLTLDYDERIKDVIYDYDEPAMRNSIFIEHPECLTSEDTASGAGASNDRTPKFYGFIEENIDPVSEQVHEYIMFPNKELTESFKTYFDYMKSTQYIDDSNEILYKKNFVHPDKPNDNEQPLYVIDYDERYGKERNNIAKKNNALSKKIDIDDYGKNNFGFVDISDAEYEDIIPLTIRLLNENKSVIYYPPGYDPKFKELIDKNINDKYKSIEFGFVPIFNEKFTFNDFFRPQINIKQPLFFRPGDILIKALVMFSTIDDFSDYLNYGSYEIVSRIRIGYLVKPKSSSMQTLKAGYSPKTKTMKLGSMKAGFKQFTKKKIIDQYLKQYEGGLRQLQFNQHNGGMQKQPKLKHLSRKIYK